MIFFAINLFVVYQIKRGALEMLKISFLGAGYMSRVHNRNLKKIDGVKVVSVCDVSIDKARNFAAENCSQEAKAYSDFNEMIDIEKPDAVIICIPSYSHCGQLEYAASKGVNIFIEKPIALDIKKAESMVEAINKYKVISQVGFHFRFGLAVSKVKSLIDEGKAGNVSLFDGRYECNSLHSDWWRDVSKSGGQIIEQAIHTYDTARYLFGEAESINAFMDNICHKHVDNYTAEDTSAAIIKFRNGSLASICASNCAIPGQWNNSFVVICEKITAYFKNPCEAEIFYTSLNEVKKETIIDETDLYYQEIQHFISCIKSGKKTLCPIEEGYETLKLVYSAFESCKYNQK